MLFEHWIYSTAIAIIAGMIHFKKTGRDYSWIIIASAYAPDFDIVADTVFNKLGIPVLGIRHGDFHNIAALLLYAGLAALVLQIVRYKYLDAFVFAGVGFGAHIFEDVLVFNPGYAFFWPLSYQKFGIGLLEYTRNLYRIADKEVLIIGLFAVMVCVIIRTMYEGNGWIKREMKKLAIIVAIMVLMISALSILDINVIYITASSREGIFVEGWQYQQDASWDSSVFHNGKYSAKIEIFGNQSKISGKWMSNPIRVRSNTTYRISAWGKTEGAVGTHSIRIVEADTDTKQTNETILEFGQGTNDWMQNQKTFKTRINTTQVFVNANIYNGYGTFWFDDIELIEEGTDKNLIFNGGFEKGDVIEFLPNQGK
ncbi:MAG: metal-dependent hydrolase [Candidatus Methanoperedens sp.]|nr:metal-dependent hydrolase [Candidatus Methanoperedens sp.]